MRVLAAALLLVVACSTSGGDPEGFCRRVDDLAADIDNGRDVDLTQRVDDLGDPGGTLSERRDHLAAAVRSGDLTEANRAFSDLEAACA